jgi:cytochrome c5
MMYRAVVTCFVAVVAGLGLGCGGALPVATPVDAARSGVALAELQQGRSLVASKCSGCHRTPLPTEHSSDEWPKMIEEMSQRAHVDGQERQAMRDYLVTMATR